MSIKKLTPKQEKFCQEIVKGVNQTQAYKIAFNPKKSSNKTINNHSYELMQNADIMARIKELREKQEKEINYSVKDSFNKFNSIQELALANKDFSTAARIEKSKGELLGFYEDRKANNVVVPIQIVFDERFKKLL